MSIYNQYFKWMQHEFNGIQINSDIYQKRDRKMCTFEWSEIDVVWKHYHSSGISHNTYQLERLRVEVYYYEHFIVWYFHIF